MLIWITSLVTLLSGGRHNLHRLFPPQMSQAALTARNRIQSNTTTLWSRSESAHFLWKRAWAHCAPEEWWSWPPVGCERCWDMWSACLFAVQWNSVWSEWQKANTGKSKVNVKTELKNVTKYHMDHRHVQQSLSGFHRSWHFCWDEQVGDKAKCLLCLLRWLF